MTQASTSTAAAAGSPGPFLKNAPKKFYAVQGTVPTLSGEAAAQVTWNQQVPIIPAYCTSIHLFIQQSIKLTFAANGDHAYISPYAPYSGWNNQLTLGGAPPWPPTELTPWYLDDITVKTNYDPSYAGLASGGNIYPAANFFGLITDQGLAAWANTIGSAAPALSLTTGATTDNLNPGAYIVNTSGGVNATLTLAANFYLEMRMQRNRHLLWGAIPFGDPENRPNNIMQLLQIVGTQPEQCVVISPAANSAAIVGALNGAATVTAVYELQYVDLLPQGVAVPEPTVGFGLQLTTSTTSGMTSGAYAPVTHRTAMAYTSIHQILINGGVGATPAYPKPIQADYYALWDDQDSQSARWAFDASTYTFQMYFAQFHNRKRRYPLIGEYTADFVTGVYPEIPSVDPYDAIMSPDATYAEAFGVPVTPAMTTTLRIPAAVTAVNPYIRTYAFGLVKVPY